MKYINRLWFALTSWSCGGSFRSAWIFKKAMERASKFKDDLNKGDKV